MPGVTHTECDSLLQKTVTMATSGLRGYLDTQKSEFLREVRGGGGLPD
eukprot:COSAG02_NODE_28581_length_586_cov_26.098563_1_plen_47_part_01